jgi:hypothetical protein
VSRVKYELGFYIPEDGILHTHRRENLKCYTADWLFGKCLRSPLLLSLCVMSFTLLSFQSALRRALYWEL